MIVAPCPPEIIKADDEGLASMQGKIANWMARNGTVLKILRSPIISGLTSKSGINRWITNHVFQHEFALGKNVKGKATQNSLENILNADRSKMFLGAKIYRDIFVESIGVNPKSIFADIRATVAGKITKNEPTFTEFSAWTAKAARRGDEASLDFMNAAQLEKYGPHVNRAAKVLRKQVDDVTKLLEKNKDFFPTQFKDGSPFNVKTAVSYLTRRYNTMVIRKTLDADGTNSFKNLLHKHFSRSIEDTAELNKAVKETFDNVMRQGDDALEMDKAVEAMLRGDNMPGFLKERVLNIPDVELERFLNDDHLDIVFGYTNQAYNILRTKEKFAEMGVSGLGDLRKMVRDDYETLITKSKSGKEIEDMTNEMKRAIEDVEDNFNIINGRFGTRNFPLLQRLRKFNVLTMLGGILLSSAPDMFMNVFKHGLPATFRDGLPVTMKQFAASKISNESLADLGIAIEVDMNSMLKALTDPEFRYGSITNTEFDKMLDGFSRTFSRATGLNVWNSAWTRIGARTNQSRLVRLMKTFKDTGSISKHEATRLARLGIGEDQYSTIIKNLDFAEDIDGAIFANAHMWDDEAKKLVADMIRRDEVILKPGRGDINKFFQGSDIGLSIFQFKSFMAAAHNKILLSGIQRIKMQGSRGAFGNEVQGLMGLISMGAIVYVTKEKIAGREADLSVENLIREGMMRSGVLGLMGESISLLPLGEKSSRFAGMNTQGAIGGASLAQAAKLMSTISGISDGDMTEKDWKRVTKFVPFNNLFYVSDLIRRSTN